MPHLSDEAICVRHWDFSETSQTVSLFCRAGGMLRGLAKGSKRVGGRFSGGIDLLTLGQVVAITKPGRDLATLTDWTLTRTWRSLRSDLAANQSAYYLVDLVQRSLEQSDPHPELFDALVAALDQIEGGRAAEATLVFQWQLLDELGYAPRLDPTVGTGASVHFSADGGGTVPDERPNAWKVRRTTVAFLADLTSSRDPGATAAAADRETLTRANRLFAAYLRHTLGAQPTTMRLLFPNL